MKLYAVIGKPILHSRSPQMHNAAFEELGIEGCYFRLATPSAKNALATFQRYGFGGYNITAPYKADMLKEIGKAEIEEAVGIIGGTNTIFPKGGGLAAFNTDYWGVNRSFLAKKVVLKGTKAVVIGAGGAGRAAAYGLHQAGAEVTIVNRTYAKAAKAADAIGCRVGEWQDLEKQVKESLLVVFTLSADIQVIKEDWLTKKMTVMDANYQYSTLQKMAENTACQFINGKDWLLQQAVPAFEYFTKKTVGNETLGAMETGLNQPYQPIPKSRTIALIGFMGSGKSSVGKVLAKQLGFDFVDVDTMIEEYIGQSIPDFFKEKGEEKFREIETICLKKALVMPKTIVACGGGVIIKETNRQLLKANALTIWLMVTPESAVNRIEDGTRPLLQGTAALKKAKTLYNKRLKWYASSADIAVDTENQTYEQISKQLYEEINTAIERYG